MSTLLEVRNLSKYFDTPKGRLHAVENVSFKLEEGQTLGVVGESGCGKSTLGRTIIHLLDSTSGQIIFDGEDITNPKNKKELKALRRNMQMIFQDPFASLNPRMTVEDIIAEPLKIYKTGNKTEIYGQIRKLMDTVGISERIAGSYPHELDGGRRQRVGIARALALEPKLIVCDEPVSALDVSIQAQILNLMQDLQKEYHLTYIFITHDMSVVKHISDNILVMYMGCMAEYSPAKELFGKQYHPYTKALLSAVPIPDIHVQRESHLLMGEITSPVNPKPGCRFAARCQYRTEECLSGGFDMEEVSPNHFVACRHKLL